MKRALIALGLVACGGEQHHDVAATTVTLPPQPSASATASAAPGRIPVITVDTSTVMTGLPPVIIQRIIRQNAGRFRLCYEKGLQSDPNLTGKVSTKFTIDPQGNVSKSESAPTTTMTDATVVACVVRAFQSLVFPRPEGGAVEVVYPLVFAPGD